MPSDNQEKFLSSIRRGATVEIRTETMLRGIIQQANAAQKAGPPTFKEWIEATTNTIPEYSLAIVGAAGQSSSTAKS